MSVTVDQARQVVAEQIQKSLTNLRKAIAENDMSKTTIYAEQLYALNDVAIMCQWHTITGFV